MNSPREYRDNRPGSAPAGQSAVSVDRQGPVAMVRFDQGDKANAISAQVLTELLKIARSFENDPEIAAVVLTGGAKVFSLGIDPTDAEVTGGRKGDLNERRRVLQLGPKVCRAWEEMDAITFAAIEGWCVGGGLALALCCDFRIAGDGAQFFMPDVRQGLTVAWGAVPRMVNLIGPARAKRLILLSQKLGCERARDWGLIDEIVLEGGAVVKAREMAVHVSGQPVVSLRMCKQSINAATKALNASTSFADADQFALALGSDETDEGLKSLMERRKPRYRGL